MNTTNDAAEQVVRMSLEGVEYALKLSGKGVEKLAAMIYAIMKDQKRTKGKTRLSSMLRSEKPLKVFAVKDDELQVFCREAKKYGVLYCLLKDKDATDGLTDIMVKADDASKINRIFERFNLSHVDVGQVKSEIERQMQEQQQKRNPEISPFPKLCPARIKRMPSLTSFLLNRLTLKSNRTKTPQMAGLRNPVSPCLPP